MPIISNCHLFPANLHNASSPALHPVVLLCPRPVSQQTRCLPVRHTAAQKRHSQKSCLTPQKLSVPCSAGMHSSEHTCRTDLRLGNSPQCQKCYLLQVRSRTDSLHLHLEGGGCWAGKGSLLVPSLGKLPTPETDGSRCPETSMGAGARQERR